MFRHFHQCSKTNMASRKKKVFRTPCPSENNDGCRRYSITWWSKTYLLLLQQRFGEQNILQELIKKLEMLSLVFLALCTLFSRKKLAPLSRGKKNLSDIFNIMFNRPRAYLRKLALVFIQLGWTRITIRFDALKWVIFCKYTFSLFYLITDMDTAMIVFY